MVCAEPQKQHCANSRIIYPRATLVTHILALLDKHVTFSLSIICDELDRGVH